MKTRMKRYIGDRKFYAMLLGIAIPIMVQNGITNFVAMIDNIMIGRVGTEQMSGVAVANQLMFVFNVSMFGMLSGAGIFGGESRGHGAPAAASFGSYNDYKPEILCERI